MHTSCMRVQLHRPLNVMRSGVCSVGAPGERFFLVRKTRAASERIVGTRGIHSLVSDNPVEAL